MLKLKLRLFCRCYLKQISYILFPILFWISPMLSLSDLVTAWPLSDSTLKLFVLVGKIMNATTVTSGWVD